MTSRGDVVQHLRRATLLRDGAGLTDGELLEAFVARRDGACFEALVRRHGPMVLGVCGRVLRDPHDAEDAFQATFLVLVRRAASVVPKERVGNWLYGVAYRTSLEARRAAARRRARERQVEVMPQPTAEPEDCWRELRPLLDRELSRLPDKYREPVVLCHLEGRTRQEAARHLGLPVGTVSGRLTTARRLLAKRLSRHGLTLSVGALASALTADTASACVPAALVASTVQAAGPAASAGVISAEVAALINGVTKSLVLGRLRLVTAVLLAAAVFGGGSAVAYRTLAAVPDKARPAEAPRSPAPAAIEKSDRERLQGAWVPVGGVIHGRKAPHDDPKVRDMLPIFDGDRVSLWDVQAPYTLNPDKNPKEMDINLRKRDGTFRAIYELDGDVLKLSWVGGEGRPPDIETGASRGVLIVLKKKGK